MNQHTESLYNKSMAFSIPVIHNTLPSLAIPFADTGKKFWAGKSNHPSFCPCGIWASFAIERPSSELTDLHEVHWFTVWNAHRRRSALRIQHWVQNSPVSSLLRLKSYDIQSNVSSLGYTCRSLMVWMHLWLRTSQSCSKYLNTCRRAHLIILLKWCMSIDWQSRDIC